MKNKEGELTAGQFIQLQELINPHLLKDGLGKEELHYLQENNQIVAEVIKQLRLNRIADYYPSFEQQLFLNSRWNKEYDLGIRNSEFKKIRKEFKEKSKNGRDIDFIILPRLRKKDALKYIDLCLGDIRGNYRSKNFIDTLALHPDSLTGCCDSTNPARKPYLDLISVSLCKMVDLYATDKTFKTLQTRHFHSRFKGLSAFVEIVYLQKTKKFQDFYWRKLPKGGIIRQLKFEFDLKYDKHISNPHNGPMTLLIIRDQKNDDRSGFAITS